MVEEFIGNRLEKQNGKRRPILQFELHFPVRDYVNITEGIHFYDFTASQRRSTVSKTYIQEDILSSLHLSKQKDGKICAIELFIEVIV
jgi:hypothetical protein